MVEGVVDFPSDPQVMKEDGQLAGHRHQRSFLGVLASALGELETPAAQVTIGSEGPENVLGAADEQATQVAVAGLSDTCTCSAGASVRSWGSRDPDWSRLGTRPRAGATSRDLRKRSGSSRVRIYARAVMGPTPETWRRWRVSG